jgi:hypothetical protein
MLGAKASRHTNEQKETDVSAPGEPVSFTQDIKPLFRERDRTAMMSHFDLWSYDDVRWAERRDSGTPA